MLAKHTALLSVLLVSVAAAQRTSPGKLPAFDPTWTALPRSFVPVSARRLYRTLHASPKGEFETEVEYRSRLEDAFVSGTHAIPVMDFKLTYDPDSGAFRVTFASERARGISVGADLSEPAMIVSARSSKMLRTEARTNLFGASIQVQVWVDTLFGVVPVDDAGEPGTVIVDMWRISPDSARAVKPVVAALLEVTLAQMPDWRQTDSGQDGDTPTFYLPRDVTRVLYVVFVQDATLVLYDRRSRRILTRLPMVEAGSDDREEAADDSNPNDTVPASPRWAIMAPPGAPREARGRHEVRFWVAADGRVTRVEVTPPIKDERYRREFVEQMMGHLFNPATTRDGRTVDFVATVIIYP
jgi:hypothetical protein